MGLLQPLLSLVLASRVSKQLRIIPYGNNISLSNGSVNSVAQLQHNLTHGDYIKLYSESVGPLNITNHQNYSWLIDGKNNQQQTIFASGTTLTTPNSLIIGPTTGFTHLPAMDDFGGVGPDFVECS